jgi:hypothetical protein
LGKTYAEIDEHLAKFIQQQHVFFVATAPSAAHGHLNLSPKGLDSFRILGTRTVAYIDLVGSGVETIAHVKENGRVVLMFCAFQGPPSVLRLHGRGRVLRSQESEFSQLAADFPSYDSVRSIIVVDVSRISTSCGYAVPLLKYEGERKQYFAWSDKKGAAALRAYECEKNARSIDGLQGITD